MGSTRKTGAYAQSSTIMCAFVCLCVCVAFWHDTHTRKELTCAPQPVGGPVRRRWGPCLGPALSHLGSLWQWPWCDPHPQRSCLGTPVGRDQTMNGKGSGRTGENVCDICELKCPKDAEGDHSFLDV